MSAQSYAEVGLDISSFSNDKKKTLNDFILLFDSLSRYDGKVFNPVLGGGLLEFNKSVEQTNTLLASLNASIVELNKNTATTGGTTKGTTKATKELTQAQAEEKIKIQETNKALLDNAKASNASIQAKNALKQAQLNLAAANKAEMASEDAFMNQLKADSKVSTNLKNKEVAESKKVAAQKRKNADDAVKALATQKKASQEVDKANQEESKTTQKLISDLKQLKLAREDQAVNYSNLYINKGKSDPATQDALNQYQQSSKVINDIEGKLGQASGQAKLFGGSLSTAFGHLRTIAYILPGIGIAGIFNLAFEAVGNLIKGLGTLGSETKEQIELARELEDAWLDIHKAYEQTFEEAKKLYAFNTDSIGEQLRLAERTQSRGFSTDVTKVDDIKNARLLVNQSNADVLHYNSNIDGLKKNTFELLDDIEKKSQSIRELKEKQASSTTFLGLGESEREKQQSEVKLLESQLATTQNEYDEKSKIIEDYYNRTQDLAKKDADYKKYLEDEHRRKVYETAQSNLAVVIDTNDKILNKDISSFDDRIRALNNQQEAQNNLARSEYANVKDNLSSTDADKKIALVKLNDDLLKIDAEYNEKREKETEDYRQRLLTANEKIDKAQVEKHAIAMEKVTSNEEINYNSRLDALSSYITDKQKLQDIETLRTLDDLKLKAKGPVPAAEVQAVIEEANQQKASLQADVEKKVFDIMYQGLSMQLKEIKDFNTIETLENEKQYTAELHDLNQSYKNKLISFEDYKKKKKEIDERGETKTLEEKIVNDELNLGRLTSNQTTLVSDKDKADEYARMAKRKQLFAPKDFESQSQAKKDVDTAVGMQEAAGKAILDNSKEVAHAQKTLADDKLKLEQKTFDDGAKIREAELKKRRQWIDGLKQIEQSLYNFVKKTIDDEYAYRAQKIEDDKKLRVEAIDAEIAAIEKSSLASKDKNALDIQLRAQRTETEKKAAKEERKIKHDQAVFDKAITITHIILSTAAAVAEALPIVPLAIAAGVAGTAELAVAAGARIPAYEHGIKSHPGGLALYGEAGPELVKEPYKSPYLVHKETISMLPRGTEVIPLKDDNVFDDRPTSDGWEQTRWLAKQLRPKPTKTKNVNIIKIDLGFENYKKTILGK